MDFCEQVQEVSIQHQLSQKCSIGIRPGLPAIALADTRQSARPRIPLRRGGRECKWTQAALAQKLGVIQQTINSWISDIRAPQRDRNIIIIRLNRLGWTREKIAKVVGLNRSVVSRIVQNTKISEMHNLLSQCRDMDYIGLLKGAG